MKIYNVWDNRDPAATDSWHPTCKEANSQMKIINEDPEADVVYRVLQFPKMNLDTICQMLTTWPHR